MCILQGVLCVFYKGCCVYFTRGAVCILQGLQFVLYTQTTRKNSVNKVDLNFCPFFVIFLQSST